MKRFGKFDKLFLIFSRRSNESVLLFSFSSETDIAMDALSTVKAFATREMVSRSEKEILDIFKQVQFNDYGQMHSPKMSSYKIVTVFQFTDFEVRISSIICGNSTPILIRGI